MVEIFRYVLAAMVAQTHLWSSETDWTGQIAVFAFYTLSGYLMVRVINERYGFTARGRAIFLLNRVLRIWPAYLVLMGMTLIALRFLPLTSVFSLIRTPATPAEIITNLLLLGQATFDFRQWIPMAKPLVTSWSLSVEMASFVLLALYFGRSASRIWLYAAIGVAAMIISTGWCMLSRDPIYGPYCFQNRYGVVQAGFVPFACGGLFYFHRQAISGWIQRHSLVAIGMLVVAFLAQFLDRRLAFTVGTYIGIPLTWVMLSCAPQKRVSRLEDFFGRASYHLFLGHMPMAAVLVTGLFFRAGSLPTFGVTVLAMLALSGLLVPMEWRINALRQRMVGRATHPASGRFAELLTKL